MHPLFPSQLEKRFLQINRRYRFKKVYNPRNIRRLKALKNKHKNQRAFIIGMGPSLQIPDLDKLNHDITFACNKIYLAFENTNWRPSYYSVSDTLVAENNAEQINALKLQKIFRDNTLEFLDESDPIWIKDLKYLPKKDFNPSIKFWKDIDTGVYRGGTVIFMQLQLAIWMGIKEIYLIGVDYDFKVSESTGQKSDVGEILKNDTERNHFHPDYRKKGETWAKPNLDLQFKAFELANDYAKKNGIKIYNASRKTKLEVFEKVEFDGLFN